MRTESRGSCRMAERELVNFLMHRPVNLYKRLDVFAILSLSEVTKLSIPVKSRPDIKQTRCEW